MSKNKKITVESKRRYTAFKYVLDDVQIACMNDYLFYNSSLKNVFTLFKQDLISQDEINNIVHAAFDKMNIFLATFPNDQHHELLLGLPWVFKKGNEVIGYTDDSTDEHNEIIDNEFFHR